MVLTRSLEANGGGDQRENGAMEEVAALTHEAILERIQIEGEWVDRDGSFTGVAGRVYYLLLSHPKP